MPAPSLPLSCRLPARVVPDSSPACVWCQWDGVALVHASPLLVSGSWSRLVGFAVRNVQTPLTCMEQGAAQSGLQRASEATTRWRRTPPHGTRTHTREEPTGNQEDTQLTLVRKKHMESNTASARRVMRPVPSVCVRSDPPPLRSLLQIWPSVGPPLHSPPAAAAPCPPRSSTTTRSAICPRRRSYRRCCVRSSRH